MSAPCSGKRVGLDRMMRGAESGHCVLLFPIPWTRNYPHCLFPLTQGRVENISKILLALSSVFGFELPTFIFKKIFWLTLW